MSNILDLQHKPQPQVKIIEKVIIKKRSWWTSLLQTFAVVIAVAGASWAISHAQFFNSTSEDQVVAKAAGAVGSRYSATGIVSDISQSSLTLSSAKSSNPNYKSFIFDISESKIFNRSRSLVTYSDIPVGSKVIVQGFILGGKVSIDRVSSIDNIKKDEEPPLEIATTTEEMASTTENIDSEVSTTTDMILDTNNGTSSDRIASSSDQSLGQEETGADLVASSTPQVPEISATSSTTVTTETTEPEDSNSDGGGSLTQPTDSSTETLQQGSVQPSEPTEPPAESLQADIPPAPESPSSPVESQPTE